MLVGRINESGEPCHQEGDVICVGTGQSRIEKLRVVCVDRRMQGRDISLGSAYFERRTATCLVFLDSGFALRFKCRVLE